MGMNALWWWIDRWRKSTAYTDMTLEEQGAYRNLLDEATLRGGPLPTDERILAKACGDALAWKKVRAKVLERFILTAQGWRHPTLDEVIRESTRRSEKQRTYRNMSGNAAGNERGNEAGNAGGNGSGNARGNYIGNATRPPDPDPSPSLSTSTKEQVLPEDLDVKWGEFQRAYPANRREGGRMALQFFIDACASVGFDVLMAALGRQKNSESWKKGYAPGMEKWLEKTMWIQEPEPDSGTGDVAAMQAHLARMDAERADRGR